MAPKRELLLVRRGSEKRLRVTLPGSAAVGTAPPSPATRMLRKIVLVLLFLLRMSERVTMVQNISKIGRMVQKLHNVQGVIIRKLEKLDKMQEQIEDISHEVKQLKLLYSNRHADIHPGLEPNQEQTTATGSNTNVQLRFLNSLKTPIYTEKDITAESNEAIRIGIFEGDNMVTDGPLSKVKVEIVILRGDFSNDGRVSWTEEQFNSHIVQGRNGQGFVLGGDCCIWLKNGENCLSKIRFKEGSSRTRSRMFIMGARVPKSENIGIRVQEAVMKPVTVLDRRNEANEKRYPPKLDDEVFRLEEISKDGSYHKRLKNAKIFTVRDFLKALNTNDKKLREEVLQMNKKTNSWDKMVRHAKGCCLRDQLELKAYRSEEENVTLFFNCVHQLVGAVFGYDYVIYDNFDPAQKIIVNKLKDNAHAKLEDTSSDYVLKNNIPELVITTPATVAGPLNHYDHEMRHQAAETVCNGQTFYPNPSCDCSTSNYNDVSTHDYRDQETMLLPDWQLDELLNESMPPAGWMAAPQSHVYQHGQDPSRLPFPGSGHNSNC
ncbi:calmodulin-binding protein 60 D-like isoform X2 [Oryza brachyantha]|uniref:calmodulin-binding protein 60 D-like isoform X2 n=1 Tax=Oryza brachyantha TaxID=4533 RepID=UPI0007769DB5|nr:calmodulin-binding protein 60 D-like isoform X2 [Oryza brachyantha]